MKKFVDWLEQAEEEGKCRVLLIWAVMLKAIGDPSPSKELTKLYLI